MHICIYIVHTHTHSYTHAHARAHTPTHKAEIMGWWLLLKEEMARNGGLVGLPRGAGHFEHSVELRQVCCSALQCVTVCCSVLQCVARCRVRCGSVSQRVFHRHRWLIASRRE